MNSTSFRSRVSLAAVWLLVWGTHVFAQNVLVSEYDGKPCPVVQVRGATPCVESGGKLVVADASRVALRKTEEYLPVFISIRGLNVRRSARMVKGRAINNEFHFHAQFETPYQLENVFVVLEMHTDLGGDMLFLQEVGRLEPRDPKTIAIIVPMPDRLGAGHHKLHLFANGAEVFHSEIPAELRESVLDRMVAKRVAALRDADPKPFVGPSPEIPAPLLKAKSPAQAVIALRVGADGRVHDPAIKSASDPAFGENALAAVKLWRFLPRVKEGRAVESQVDMPFDLGPPGKAAGKS